MTADMKQFRMVMRGYDPEQVDHALLALITDAMKAEQQVVDLSRRLQDLEKAYAEARQQTADDSNSAPPSFRDLGERVEKILTLADEEAAAIRAAAKSDFELQQRVAEEAAEGVRAEGEKYAEQQRSAAEEEAARIRQDASDRLQEAEVVYERQREKAEQALADLEETLASRWKSAEEDLAPMEARLQEMHTEVDRLRSDAQAQARQLIEDAEERAREIVAGGTAEADRIRAESERELAATTERRDSINAELTKVLKSMLTTVSQPASAAGPAVHVGNGDPGEIGQADDQGVAAANEHQAEFEHPQPTQRPTMKTKQLR